MDSPEACSHGWVASVEQRHSISEVELDEIEIPRFCESIGACVKALEVCFDDQRRGLVSYGVDRRQPSFARVLRGSGWDVLLVNLDPRVCVRPCDMFVESVEK